MSEDKQSLLAQLTEQTSLPKETVEAAVQDPACSTVADVIDHYYQTWATDEHTKDGAMGVFKKFPALVSANLVQHEVIDVPVDIRTPLMDVLKANSTELDYLKMPLDAVVKILETHLVPAQTPFAARLLRGLQRLTPVIVEPADLGVLLRCGYTSPEDIAYSPVDHFVSVTSSKKVDAEHAKRIHRQAVTAQSQIEQVWMTMLHGERVQDVFPRPSKVPQEDTAKNQTNKPAVPVVPPKQPEPAAQETIADWFGDLDEVACEECCSVTSPAAYLVDLLRFLKVGRVPDIENKDKKVSLLSRFFERRPDIGDLLLSCRNTNELVPYVDLANEVMESAVQYCNKNKSERSATAIAVQGFNADDHETRSQGTYGAQNTQSDVYRKFLSSKVFPSSIFPFEHSRLALDNYTAISGPTLAEIRAAFWLDEVPGANQPPAETLQATLRRAQAADVLGLSNLDFLALTDEGIWTLLAKDSSSLPLKKPQYWGYEGEKAETDMLDAVNGTGLPFIKQQLLPRLEMDFTTLCDILKTRYLAGALMVALMPDQTDFPEDEAVPTKFADFRLCCRAGEPLDIPSCNRLGQFVRIWQRLEWTISEVDDGLSRFGAVKGTALFITPDTIEELAAVQKIAKTTKWPPKLVLALWNSSSEHVTELMAFQGSVQTSTTTQPDLQSPRALLLAAIEMTYEDYVWVMATQELQSQPASMIVFLLNRAQSLAKMFGVTVQQLASLLDILSPGRSVYSSPRALAEVLARWQELTGSGWDFPALQDAAREAEAPLTTRPSVGDKSREVIVKAVNALVQLRATMPASAEEQTPSSTLNDKVRVILARAVEGDIASLLSGLDGPTLKFLLNENLEGRPKSEFTAILDAVMETSPASADALSLPSDGGFVLSSEACEILIEPVDTEPWDGLLAVDAETIKLRDTTKPLPYKVEKGALTWIAYATKPRPLKLRVKAPNTAHATLAFISTGAIRSTDAGISRLKRFANISIRSGLSARDMAAIFGANRLPWTGPAFEKGAVYSRIRENFRTTAPKFDFPKLGLWLLEQTTSETNVASELAKVTTLPAELVRMLLQSNFSTQDPAKLKQILTSQAALERISRQAAILSRLGLGAEAVKLLCDFVLPPSTPAKPAEGNSPPSVDADSAAGQLVELIKAACLGKGRLATVRNIEDQLRVRRRRALVAYLLQDDFFNRRKIIDANGLFEHFLIDVQMGVCLETSRIKQAISTVQLFVQRCLLGLEAGVDSVVIDKSRWDWMQRYNLWEANRKIFLYPENWADPSLRDNKTELFKSIETSIMQTNLDEKAVSKMIRDYVYGIGETTNLRIESYIWDRKAASSYPSEGSFHFFGRTRNAPFQYFYRRLTYLSQNAPPLPVWTSWQKIPLDIRSHDVDVNGDALSNAGTYMIPACWNNRLFLFLPQITTKLAPKDTSDNKLSYKTNDDKVTTDVKVASGPGQVNFSVEIKIGWSEYVETDWTPAVQAHESVNLLSVADKPIKIDDFRFWVDEVASEFHNLSVYVFHGNGDGFLSRFELQGTRLVKMSDKGSIDSKIDVIKVVPSTSFGRYTSTVAAELPDSAKPLEEAAQKDLKLRLAKPKLYTSSVAGNVIWTLNSAFQLRTDDARPLGLVADIETKDGVGNETWFTLPEFAIAATPESKHRFYDDEMSTTLYNPIGERLRTAVASQGGVSEIFKIFDDITVREDIVPPPIPAVVTPAPGVVTTTPAAGAVVKTPETNKQNAQNMYKDAFGLFWQLLYCNENSTPYAIYNWELGFHLVSLIVERLLSLQQFDLAIKYSRLVFDSTRKFKGEDAWRFPPFRDSQTRKAGTIDSIFNSLRPSSGEESKKKLEILDWEKHPFSPHVVARGRPLAYMKRFVMKYIEVLIASGDKYFRESSLETVPLAIQRYVEASHILGAASQKVPKIGQVKFASYNQIIQTIDDFSNARVPFQLAFPYILPAASKAPPQKEQTSPPGWTLTRYFGVQANPAFSELRKLVNDRLTKIRSCLDIDGKPRKLALFDPPIDPGAVVAAMAGGGGLGAVLDAFEGSLPRQRFMYLLQKAMELCAELKQMTNSFLMHIEKRESEGLQMLRAVQDTKMQAFLIDMKLKQKKEAEKGIEQLKEARKAALARWNFFSAWNGSKESPPAPDAEFEEPPDLPARITLENNPLRLTKHEQMELDCAADSRSMNDMAMHLDLTTALLSLIPQPSLNVQPLGVGVSTSLPRIADATQFIASRFRAQASLAMEDSQRGARMAQFERQLQERQMQIHLAGREMKGVDKQVEVQQAHIAVIEHDILAQQKMADNAAATEEFFRAKYTRQELYGWLEGSVRSLLYQTYILVMEMAKKAEQAFAFETGNPPQQFIRAAGYWDDGRQGLDAGEQLWLALKRMELAYTQGRYHDFEISKDISLRQVSSQALLNLRKLASAEFALPEALFDMDFPGHYCRRIKSVAVSIHCLSGPYASVNATLTLSAHSTRINDSQGTQYMRKGEEKDARFSDNAFQIPINAVALSSGQFDSGVFELDFRGSNYQPFEGAGLISKWQLQLPAEFRQFDYGTISDVVLHIRYTSKNGSKEFRNDAVLGLTAHMQQATNLSERFGLHMFINLTSDYPDAWVPLAAQTAAAAPSPLGGSVGGGGGDGVGSGGSGAMQLAVLTKLRDHLPFFARHMTKLMVQAISVYASFSGAKPTTLKLLPRVAYQGDDKTQPKGALIQEGAIPITAPSAAGASSGAGTSSGAGASTGAGTASGAGASSSPDNTVEFRWDGTTSTDAKSAFLVSLLAVGTVKGASGTATGAGAGAGAGTGAATPSDGGLNMLFEFGTQTDPGRAEQIVLILEYRLT